MISTGDLSGLPAPPRLREVMQALAALDAIMSPEWESRYYSFNAGWAEGEMMGSLRNGQGDELFAHFSAAGVFIKGFDHERRQRGLIPETLYNGVPAAFAQAVAEPAFSPEDVTFCCWRTVADGRWSAASALQARREADGSEWLMALLDGDPDSFRAFARRYHEAELPARPVAEVCAHAPMTQALAASLNPDADYPALLDELSEIGYPIAGS